MRILTAILIDLNHVTGVASKNFFLNELIGNKHRNGKGQRNFKIGFIFLF